MLKLVKILLKVIGFALLTIFLIVVGFVVYITVNDYEPPKVEVIVEKGSNGNIQMLEQDTFVIREVL